MMSWCWRFNLGSIRSNVTAMDEDTSIEPPNVCQNSVGFIISTCLILCTGKVKKIIWIQKLKKKRCPLHEVARFDAVRDGTSLDDKPDGEFPTSFTGNISSEYYKHGLYNADVVLELRENLTFRRRGNMVGYLSHMSHMRRLMAHMAVAQTL